MILVDTSAWIDFFRDKGTLAERVDLLLEANDVAIGGPVLTEILRGVRAAKDRTRVATLLEGCTWLSQPESLWQDAGELGARLARSGMNAKTMDLLIASYGLAHNVPILTRDRDFSEMKKAGIPLLLA